MKCSIGTPIVTFEPMCGDFTRLTLLSVAHSRLFKHQAVFVVKQYLLLFPH